MAQLARTTYRRGSSARGRAAQPSGDGAAGGIERGTISPHLVGHAGPQATEEVVGDAWLGHIKGVGLGLRLC